MNPEDNIAPEDEAQITAEIEKAHFAPPAMFAGKELWPYTRASRFWFQQCLGPDDLLSFRDLAFCFVHLKRGGGNARDDVFSVMQSLQNGALLRIQLGDWLETLSGGDFTRADALYLEAKAVRASAEMLEQITAVQSRDPAGVTN